MLLSSDWSPLVETHFSPETLTLTLSLAQSRNPVSAGAQEYSKIVEGWGDKGDLTLSKFVETILKFLELDQRCWSQPLAPKRSAHGVSLTCPAPMKRTLWNMWKMWLDGWWMVHSTVLLFSSLYALRIFIFWCARAESRPVVGSCEVTTGENFGPQKNWVCCAWDMFCGLHFPVSQFGVGKNSWHCNGTECSNSSRQRSPWVSWLVKRPETQTQDSLPSGFKSRSNW